VDASPIRPRATGVARYAAELISALPDAGVDPVVLTPRPGAYEAQMEEGAPAPLGTRWPSFGPTLPWLQAAAGRAATRSGALLFHATTGRAPVLGRTASVVTVHDLTVLTHPEWYPAREAWLAAPWLRRSVRRCRAVIAVSRATATELQSVLGPINAPVHVIGEAAGEAFHAPIAPERVQRAAGVAKGAPYYLSVGSLTPRKNPLVLLEAYARAAGELDRLPHLVFAGPGGPLATDVLSKAREAGLGERVVVAGWIHDLPAAMRGAAGVVCPSLHEGFGLPVAEAMAVGAPVIASRRGGLPELLGEAGLLAEPDVDGLAAALVSLARNPALGEQLGSAAAERSRRLRWRAVARSTAGVYRETLGVP
jgi:glycosyltransferase involved in cell wall biosynthesis